MRKGKSAFIFQTIVIAIAYVILTLIANAFSMAKGIVQVRISDALCVMPFFTPAAIPGLVIGSVVSNIIISVSEDPITGAMVLSSASQYYVIFCGIAIFAGSIGAYLLRKNKFIVSIPAIILNTVTVVLLFRYAFRFEDSSLKCLCTVGVGEIIACGLLGTALLLALEDSWDKWFPKDGVIVEEPMETAGVIESREAESNPDKTEE